MVQCIMSRLFVKGRYVISKMILVSKAEDTYIGKRKDGLRGLYHHFHLTDSESFVSQTLKISSHRPQHFHLTDPNIAS